MMPQLGETVTEGTITRWMKAVGDAVERDEPLFEVSTDKVDSEVPSPAAGVLSEILVPEGETVEVGVKLAVIGDGAGGVPFGRRTRRCGGGIRPRSTGPGSRPPPQLHHHAACSSTRSGTGPHRHLPRRLHPLLRQEQRGRRRAQPAVAHGAQAPGRERHQ